MKLSELLPLPLLGSLIFLSPLAAALGQDPTITTIKPENGRSSPLQIAGKGLNGQILVSKEEWWGVLRVAEDLAGDLGKVVGENLNLAYWDGRAGRNASRGGSDSDSEGSGSGENGKDRPPPPPQVYDWDNGNGEGRLVGSIANPGGNKGHNATVSSGNGSRIEVLYTYRAPTNNINVSLFPTSLVFW